MTASLYIDLREVDEACDILLSCYDSDGRYLASLRENDISAPADSVTLAKRFVFDEHLTDEVTVKVFVLRSGAWVPFAENGKFHTAK